MIIVSIVKKKREKAFKELKFKVMKPRHDRYVPVKVISKRSNKLSFGYLDYYSNNNRLIVFREKRWLTYSTRATRQMFKLINTLNEAEV